MKISLVIFALMLKQKWRRVEWRTRRREVAAVKDTQERERKRGEAREEENCKAKAKEMGKQDEERCGGGARIGRQRIEVKWQREEMKDRREGR